MQPVEDPPFGQRDDGIRLTPRVVLQRPERVYCNKSKRASTHSHQLTATDPDATYQTAGGGRATHWIDRTAAGRTWPAAGAGPGGRGGRAPSWGTPCPAPKTERESPLGKLKPHQSPRARNREIGGRAGEERRACGWLRSYGRPTLLYHGSWRMSLPRLCTMQGPGTAAPAPAGGADDDRSRRICGERRAAAERNIAAREIFQPARRSATGTDGINQCSAAGVRKRCAVVVREARARGRDFEGVASPCVCRHPRWGQDKLGQERRPPGRGVGVGGWRWSLVGSWWVMRCGATSLESTHGRAAARGMETRGEEGRWAGGRGGADAGRGRGATSEGAFVRGQPRRRVPQAATARA